MIQRIKISNIFSGRSQTQYFGADGSFNASIAIDPDFPITGSDVRTSGAIVPVGYSKFSSTGLTGYPNWIINNPKNTTTYVYDSAANFLSYDSALSTETALTTPSSASGNGGAYYDNYVYLAKNTDIARYGPLNGSPSLTQSFWVGTLGKTALSNTTYPTLRGNKIPNHPMWKNPNESTLYVGDVTATNIGCIHAIRTTRTTVEGDTDNSSTYNALELDYGEYPTTISTWNLNIAVGAINCTDTGIIQGPASLFLWDGSNTQWQRHITLDDPYITAARYVNGVLHIWTGNGSGGYRLRRYVGGDSFEDLEYFEEGFPPFHGAVDVTGGRVSWGSFTTYPTTSASVFSVGSKNQKLPMGLQNIVKTTSSGANQNVTSLKYVQQSSSAQPKLVVGWGDDSAKGLDKFSSSATLGSVFRSAMYNVGQRFRIVSVRIPLGTTVAANMSIVPKIYLDDLSSSVTLPTISTTLHSGKRKALYKRPDLKSANGENNFLLELTWSGTAQLPVTMPIIIEIEIPEGEPDQAL